MRKSPLHLILETALVAPRQNIILAMADDKATLDAADGIPGNLTRCFVRIAAEK